MTRDQGIPTPDEGIPLHDINDEARPHRQVECSPVERGTDGAILLAQDEGTPWASFLGRQVDLTGTLFLCHLLIGVKGANPANSPW